MTSWEQALPAGWVTAPLLADGATAGSQSPQAAAFPDWRRQLGDGNRREDRRGVGGRQASNVLRVQLTGNLADVTLRFENPGVNDGPLQCGQALPSPKN